VATLGPVESIVGVLMCGLSASFLFAIVSRLVDRETRLSREPAKPTELISTAKRSQPSDAATNVAAVSIWMGQCQYRAIPVGIESIPGDISYSNYFSSRK